MAKLVELRLGSFKSFRGAVLLLRDLTLLIGRNGSGKSNALDGLWTLSRLASGDDIKEAIDGGLDGPAVRGGVAGCPPYGEVRFRLGCVIEEDARRLRYDVEVAVEPVVQVTAESLTSEPLQGSAASRELLTSDPADLDRGELVARWNNRKRGRNPPLPMRASRLLLSQVPTRVPATNQAGRDVHAAAETVLGTLANVVVLDAVPHAMRTFVPERDVELRRNAENLSAALAAILRQEGGRARVHELLTGISEPELVEVGVARSELGDVMLTLRERIEGRDHPVPARQMSDGTLRFLAVVTAVMQPSGEHRESPERTLVVEELENGLHPSQAARALTLLADEAATRGIRLLATTHSPTMLDALPGEQHDRIVVCDRARDGWSRLTVLPELPAYLDVVTTGGPGEAAVRDELHPTEARTSSPAAALDALLDAG